MKIALSLPFRTFDLYTSNISMNLCRFVLSTYSNTRILTILWHFVINNISARHNNYINKLCMLLCSDRQIRISIIMFLSDKTIIDSQNKYKNIILVIDNEGWWHEQFYQWENVFEMGDFEKVSLYYTPAVSLVALSLL